MNRISEEEQMTPLMVAAERGRIEIVQVLIQAGVDINLPDRNNHTALHHAVAGNRPEIVKLLIASGAEPNRVGTIFPHNTPLMFAVMKGRAMIARALLDGGADVDAADENGNTALIKAGQFGKFNLEVRDDPQRPGGRQAVLYLNSWLFHNPSSRVYHTIVRLD